MPEHIPLRIYYQPSSCRKKYLFFFSLLIIIFSIIFIISYFRYYLFPSIKVPPPPLRIFFSSDKYYRFELVTVYLDIRDKQNRPVSKGSSVSNNGVKIESEIKDPAGNRVITVGYQKSIKFKFLNDKGLWVGKWPVPWNPELGRYKLIVKVEWTEKIKKSEEVKRVQLPFFPWIKIPYPESKSEKAKKKEVVWQNVKREYKREAYFEIAEKTPPPISLKPCVVDLESAGNILGVRIPDTQGKIGDWKNMFSWIEFMGANTLWYLVGQTASWGNPRDLKGPWMKSNLESYPALAKEAHKRGIKFGGWIACFLTFGTGKPYPYNYALIYSPKQNKCVPSRYISLLCEKRIKDIIYLAKTLQKNPYVDYIGLDYIRGAEGGYEMVDEFVEEMEVSTPPDFSKFNKEQRINWLGRQIALHKDTDWKGRDIYDQWNWWRAYKIANIVQRIKREANIKKPLWVFILGWKHGRQHGQDPLMMNDAGVYINAIMLYEIDRKLFPYMIDDWKNYLKRGDVNLIVGNTVDWPLHQKSLNPPGPEEFYHRLMQGFHNLYGGKPCQGIFWHDLGRGLWGRKGPYPLLEWAVAGASAFSRVREEWSEVPLKIRLKVPSSITVGREFPVDVKINKIKKGEFDNLTISGIDSPAVKWTVKSISFKMGKDEDYKILELSAKVIQKIPNRDGRFLVAVELRKDRGGDKFKLMDFKYIKISSLS